MKKLILLIIFINILFLNTFSQSDSLSKSSYESKNTIYVNLGVGGVSYTLNVNYERKIIQTNDAVLSSLWIKGQGGAWGAWDSEGTQFSFAAVGLSGQKNNHFEYGLGVSSLYDKAGYRSEMSSYNAGHENEHPSKLDNTDFTVYANIGYRFQKTDGSIVFRTGLAYPEGLYLSFGFAF